MIGCIWYVLGALYGTRAKPGNHLVVYKGLNTRLQFYICNTKVTKSQWQRQRCVLFCALYTVYTDQCPPQGTSLEVSLPPYRPSSHDPLHRSVAPSLIRSLRPSPPFLAPSMPTFLPHSFPSSTLPSSSTPAPSITHIIASSLDPPLAPISILHPIPLLPCLPPCPRCPIQCTPYVCLANCTVLCSA